MSDRRDPTRSAGLRRHGRTLVNRRVYSLQQGLRQGLQEQDAAGLRTMTSPPIAFINWMESVSHKLARAEGLIENVIVQNLMTPPQWPRDLIERSVQHGIELVEQELRTSLDHLDGGEVSRLHTMAATTEVRGIAGETVRRLLRLVVHALEAKERPEILMREVRRVLEKITRLRLNLMVNTGVVRAVNAGKLFAYEFEGIERVGIDPEWLPRNADHKRVGVGDHHRHDHVSIALSDVRSRKAKRRKRTATNKARRKRTRSIEEEILIAAMGPAAGSAFLAIEKVVEGIEEEPEPTLVNVLTAGDDRVCIDCEDIAEGGPYEINAARDLIPAHPNCRCAFIPFGDKRFAPIEEQEEEWE